MKRKQPKPSKKADAQKDAPVYGSVKSFNGSKGYGFLESSEVDGDIMFHKNDLPEDMRELQGHFLTGKNVNFVVIEADDGRLKASQIDVTLSEGNLLAGVIKSYSQANRYGFLTCSSMPGEDIRFNASDLELPMMTDAHALVGICVLFEPQNTADGKTRVSSIKFQDNKTQMGLGFGMPSFGMGGCGGGAQMHGIVKSFSEKNGYGFINLPGVPIDIKFGLSDCQAVPSTGQAVSFKMAMSQSGGMQAQFVKPSGGNAGGGMKRKMQSGMAGARGMPAMKKFKKNGNGTVKSYSVQQGFGFITARGFAGDIYFMRKNLPQDYQTDDVTGASVSFEITQKADGKLAAARVFVE